MDEVTYTARDAAIRVEVDAAYEVGWQPPPFARIPVALAGAREADWSLDDDEKAF